MEVSNDITQKLKQVIHEYYMKKIKDKFSFFGESNQEKQISNEIMQLIDSKVADGNSVIGKDEITQILRNIILDEVNDSMIYNMRLENINEVFPDVATITIEEGQTAYLEETKIDFLGEKESKTSYLYLSQQYYDSHIKQLESMIKQLEREFTTKDIEQFDEQYSIDSTIKEYELNSAREYEDARNQIKQKEKKYDAVKNKMINEYGKKYQEIMAKTISDEEKHQLLAQLLEETTVYDKKSNTATLQLQEEMKQLSNRFQNKAKISDDIIKDMAEMNLFDRDRYIQDKKGEQNPQLAKLYAKRDNLNYYRREHGEPVFEVKQNPFTSILNSIARNIRGEKPQLLLEYHPERDISTGVNPIIVTHKDGIDENLIKTLAHLYGEQANKKEERFSNFDDENQKIETNVDISAFEEHLVKYFRAHYNDIMEEGFNNFLSEFAEMPDKYEIYKKEGELAKIARGFGIDPEKFKYFGYKFSIREGLIYEADSLNKIKAVHYATDKGINSVIESLYSIALYKEHTGVESIFISNIKELKNGFIEYAKQNGINIENKYVLETMEVNYDKVNDISIYINELVNKELSRGQEEYIPTDYTETIAEDLAENYSTVMNLDYYSFGNLSSVKSILGNQYLMDDHLKISDDSVLKTDEFDPRVVYATPEYCAREYNNIMNKIYNLNATSDPFIDGYFEITKANVMKDTLRQYIKNHGIDIDTSIKQATINQERIDLIADALVENYADKARNQKTFKSEIVKKLQDNWSEIINEMQVVNVGDMFKDELKQNVFIDEKLYIRDDFTYLGDYMNFHAKCIYATPEYLSKAIAKLDEKIDSSFKGIPSNDEKRARNVLTQYAKENNIKINTPSVRDRISRNENKIFEESRMFGGILADSLPDDPTAREKIESNDNLMNIVVKMAEGNPGALTGLTSLIRDDAIGGAMLILGLDDMNIRGSQIWQVYKYYCNEDVEKFKEIIHNRDKDMIQYLNEQNAVEGQEKAVTSGASFYRSKRPSLYRFTAEDVELYREAKEERVQKSKEASKQTDKDKREHKDKKRYIRRRNKTIEKIKEKTRIKEKRKEDISNDFDER